MASIVKRGNSYCVVYYTVTHGERKQKWETYYTLEEAEQRRELLKLCERQRKKRDSKTVETVAQFMEEYIRLYGLQRWSLSVYQSNCGLIQHYIIPLLGSMRLSELSPRVVAELYRKLVLLPKAESPYHKGGGRKISVNTLKSIHKVLHSAFEQAVLWEYMPQNPFYRAALPKIPPAHRPFLTPEQVEAFLNNCRDETLALAVHLAFSASMRKGELLALTWKDIDFENCFLHVNKTLARVSREALEQLNFRDVLFQFPPVSNELQTMLVLKRPKTDSSVRRIYLPESVITLLQAYQKMSMDVAVKGNLEFPDLIFSYPDGRPLQECTISKMFRGELDRQCLPKVCFHSLRHSSITYKLILSGGNIKAVQGDSGHAQADMITELYGHILDTSRRENTSRFEQDFYQK